MISENEFGGWTSLKKRYRKKKKKKTWAKKKQKKTRFKTLNPRKYPKMMNECRKLESEPKKCLLVVFAVQWLLVFVGLEIFPQILWIFFGEWKKCRECRSKVSRVCCWKNHAKLLVAWKTLVAKLPFCMEPKQEKCLRASSSFKNRPKKRHPKHLKLTIFHHQKNSK